MGSPRNDYSNEPNKIHSCPQRKGHALQGRRGTICWAEAKMESSCKTHSLLVNQSRAAVWNGPKSLSQLFHINIITGMLQFSGILEILLVRNILRKGQSLLLSKMGKDGKKMDQNPKP